MALLSSQPKRTDMGEILLAIKAQIVARAVVPPSMVQLTIADSPPSTKAEKLVYLRPRRFMAGQDEVRSAGRLDTRVMRQIDVYLRSRVSLDPINGDEIWLTDLNRGFFGLENDILNALQDFLPTDSDGNNLTCYDIRLLSGSEADKDAQAKGWGRASATYEVVHMPPLSLADISPTTFSPSAPPVWTNLTAYNVGDFASDAGVVYQCSTAHTSASGSEPGVGGSWQTYWNRLPITVGDTVSLTFSGSQNMPTLEAAPQAWLTATAYAYDARVTDGGKTFACLAAHTSGASTEPGVGGSWQTYWTQTSAAAWVTATTYSNGAQVTDRGKAYSCITPHLSAGATEPGIGANWQGYWQPIALVLPWLTATAYAVGDRVTDNSQLYVCTAAHTSGATTEPGTGANWRQQWVASPSWTLAPLWKSGAPYQVGAYVTDQPSAWVTATPYLSGATASDGGQSFACILGHTSGASSKPGTGASWTTYWIRTAPTYQCLAAHTSGASTEPGVGVSWQTYWTLASLLPAGLTINPATGTISGVPTAAGNGPATTTLLVLTVSDALTQVSGWSRYRLEIAIQITGTLPGGTHGTSYGNHALTATGATGAVTWSVQPNSGAFGAALPAGLTLNATTGVVSGTPTTAGTSAFTVLATDSKGNTGTQTFTVVIS